MGLFSKEITATFSGLADTAKGLISQFKMAPSEKAAAELLMLKEINRAKEEIEGRVERREQQLTNRHQADMNSDSWLSKNIRPLSLLFLLIVVTALAFISVFMQAPNIEVLKIWAQVFGGLLGLAFGFYFGSRGIEKVAQTIGNAFAKAKQGPKGAEATEWQG